jgi:outer membrane lipoprotein-sorting protein
MFRRVKVLALPLMMVAILAALSFSGCREKATQSEDASQLDLPKILSDATLAMKDVSSYSYSMVMDMDMEATGGSSAGTISMSMGSDGVTDFANNQMQMNLEMSMDQDIPEMEGSVEYKAEMYVLTDWIYIKLDIAGLDQQWVKMPMSEELMQSYNLNVIEQQFEPLERATQIEYIKSESVDGSDCYVLKIVPDLAAMKEWIDEQQMTSETFDWSQIEKLEDIFKKLDYNVWIAKDTKLIKKMNIQMTMELSSAQLDVEESEFDKMTMDVEIEMTLKHYNEPVSITLPDEAENAMEM